MKYTITQEQMDKLSGIIAEVPTKFGVPMVNILNSLEKVEVKEETQSA